MSVWGVCGYVYCRGRNRFCRWEMSGLKKERVFVNGMFGMFSDKRRDWLMFVRACCWPTDRAVAGQQNGGKVCTGNGAYKWSVAPNWYESDKVRFVNVILNAILKHREHSNAEDCTLVVYDYTERAARMGYRWRGSWERRKPNKKASTTGSLQQQ